MKSAREIFAENLQSLIDSKGIDQTVLAEHLGVSNAAVSYWLSGEKYPRIDKIQKIADYFNVPKSSLTEQRATNIIEIQPNFVKIPILGTIACGNPITAEQNIEEFTYELADDLPTGNIFALTAKGDSMEPTIPNGSKVFIREQPDCENGEIAAVLLNGDNEATLKRIRKQGKTIILLPDNPKYGPIIVDEYNPARIIGKAIRVIRDLI